ncbi:MAG: hypothetical protein ACYS6K_23460, partial [Planctomycetota bacterium]
MTTFYTYPETSPKREDVDNTYLVFLDVIPLFFLLKGYSLTVVNGITIAYFILLSLVFFQLLRLRKKQYFFFVLVIVLIIHF